MRKNEFMKIEMPKNFDFLRSVRGHGWYQLSPFRFDEQTECLSYVFNVVGKSIAASIGRTDDALRVNFSDGDINYADREQIKREFRHILRLDDDLTEFYEITDNDFRWISQTNAGRMLRSPTVYEDLVKTICTTNCSWALTKKMTTNLVEKIGTPDADGRRAFPTAEQMASESIEFYQTKIRAGYRSAYFVELAEKVAGGEINPESWLNSALPTAELKREMKKIKGVGDYAAENLLKLVGRYDGLALDSWLRAQFYKKHNAAVACDDGEIRNFYEKYGAWRGLVMWCEMSEK